MQELQSLIDYGRFSPALPSGHPFDNVQNLYWSSTTLVYDTFYAWRVSLYDGSVNAYDNTYGYHVWPVRGGQ